MPEIQSVAFVWVCLCQISWSPCGPSPSFHSLLSIFLNAYVCSSLCRLSRETVSWLKRCLHLLYIATLSPSVAPSFLQGPIVKTVLPGMTVFVHSVSFCSIFFLSRMCWTFGLVSDGRFQDNLCFLGSVFACMFPWTVVG